MHKARPNYGGDLGGQLLDIGFGGAAAELTPGV